MHMWVKMMPNRGLSEYSARISSDALELLASEDDHMFFRGHVLTRGWIGESVPITSSHRLSHQMIEVILVFYLN